MSAIVEDVSITSAAEEVVGEVVGEGDAGTGDSQVSTSSLTFHPLHEI